jgi:hypothetical protein
LFGTANLSDWSTGAWSCCVVLGAARGRCACHVLRWFCICTLQILDTPSLLADASSGAKKNIFKQKPPEADAAASSCC